MDKSGIGSIYPFKSLESKNRTGHERVGSLFMEWASANYGKRPEGMARRRRSVREV